MALGPDISSNYTKFSISVRNMVMFSKRILAEFITEFMGFLGKMNKGLKFQWKLSVNPSGVLSVFLFLEGSVKYQILFEFR